VSSDVEELFTEAARSLARTTRRYPVNISSINDIMRHKDRWVMSLIMCPGFVDFSCCGVRWALLHWGGPCVLCVPAQEIVCMQSVGQGCNMCGHVA
jgi:hypothetical protein